MSRTTELTNSTWDGLMAGHLLGGSESDSDVLELGNATYAAPKHRFLRPTIVYSHRTDFPSLVSGSFALASAISSAAAYDLVRELTPNAAAMVATAVSAIEDPGSILRLIPWTNAVAAVCPTAVSLPGSGDAKNVSLARFELTVALDRVSTELTGPEIVSAHVAIAEAAEQLAKLRYTQQPWFGVSDEGVVIVQWQSGDRGLMLVFCGDGFVTFSERRPGGHYISQPQQFAVGDLPTSQFDEAIRRVLS